MGSFLVQSGEHLAKKREVMFCSVIFYLKKTYSSTFAIVIFYGVTKGIQ